MVLCREEPPARCCSRVVHTNGRCGTQTEPARNWRSSDLVRCVESSKDMEVRIGARRAPHRFPCERATKAVSTVHSESTRRNDDTPDLNEPLNTNHRGGRERICVRQRCRLDMQARAAAQCRVGVLAAHEQTARPPASECLARSRQYSPSVLHVSYRPRRDWELGSHARLPHTEPYILFVIIFEPLIEPGSQLLARSSSTTPCPHLPGSASSC